VQEQEHEQRHDHHDGDGREQAADDVGGHRSTFMASSALGDGDGLLLFSSPAGDGIL
jgi:hypothetical protein